MNITFDNHEEEKRAFWHPFLVRDPTTAPAKQPQTSSINISDLKLLLGHVPIAALQVKMLLPPPLKTPKRQLYDMALAASKTRIVCPPVPICLTAQLSAATAILPPLQLMPF